MLAACSGDAMPAPAGGILPDPDCGAAFWAAGFAGEDVGLLLLIVLAGLTGLVVGLAAALVLAGAALGDDTGFAAGVDAGLFGAGAFTTTAGFLLMAFLPATTGFFAGAAGLAALFAAGLAAVLAVGLVVGLRAGFALASVFRDGAEGLDFATGFDLTTGFDVFFAGALTALPDFTAGLPDGVFFAVFVLAIVGTLLSR